MINKLARNVIARQVLRYLAIGLNAYGLGASDLLADPEMHQIVMICVGSVLSVIVERAWIIARRLGLTT